MKINSVPVSFNRGYENMPMLLIVNTLHHEKFILISYFFSAYDRVFLIDRFIKEIEEPSISKLEFEIGYGAGCLHVSNSEKVFFETYGDDLDAVTIEMSFLNFKKLCSKWREFLYLEQEHAEYICEISNTYYYLCMKFEDQIYKKYNLFRDFYLSPAKMTTRSLIKLQALAYYITDRDDSIQHVLDEVNVGKRDVSASYFLPDCIGILTLTESTLNFQAFESHFKLESFKLTIFEFQEVVSEWKSFVNSSI